MSNRAFLLNFTDHPDEALEGKTTDDTSIVVAEGSNRVPATWLFCFSENDLLFSDYLLSEREDLKICTPYVTVKKAVQNLHTAGARLGELAGGAAIAAGYLNDALSALDSLPHTYLTIDYSELLCLFDEEEGLSLFAESYGLSDKALENIKRASAFVDGVAPYPIDEFYAGEAKHVQRMENSAALCFGCTYFPTDGIQNYQMGHNPSSLSPVTTNENSRPWWKFWG